MKINLTMREQKRVNVVQGVFRGELTMSQAAKVLGVSERQAYRIKKDILGKGVRGAVHGNRVRQCAWRVAEEVKGRILTLQRHFYFTQTISFLRENFRNAQF